MRILDRYILNSVLKLFFSCLLGFVFLYVIIDLFSHLDVILNQNAGIKFISDYYMAQLPIIFVQVTPISSLIATLYTFAKLNHNNEIIAMRSAGLSINRVAKTVIIFGILLSLVIFLANEKFIPSATKLMEQTKQILEGQNKKTQSQENIKNLSMYGLKNRLFFINTFDPSTNTMEGIVILEQDKDQNITKKIVANKGEYREGIWRFYRSITYNFNKNGQMEGDPQYMEEEIMIITETPQDFLNQRQRPEQMSTTEIKDYIWKLSQSGAVTVIRNLKVDLYQKFIFPLTSLITILLAIPFSLKIGKRAAALSSLGISFLVAFLYYAFNAICVAFGKAGILPPWAAASLSQIIFGGVSIYMIRLLP